MQVAFGPYAPDQGSRVARVSPYVLNAIPKSRTQRGVTYGPLGSLSPVSDALGSRPLGGTAGRDDAGNVATFIADGTDLFKLDGQSWTNVSKSNGAYTTDPEIGAEFAQFGDRIIAALGVSDPMQSYLLSSSSAFSDLAAAAPRARHIAVMQDTVMVGNTFDSSDGARPGRVWWSAFNDPTSWPTPGTSAAAAVQSDYQDLPDGGWVQHIAPSVGGVAGTVVMEKAIYRVAYQGPPTIFGFYPVERNRGTPAPRSCVNIGSAVAYLGEQGFFIFDGQQSIAIGDQKVDKAFFADLNQSYFHRVVGVNDPINKVVFWAYPGAGSTGGRPNRLIMYNWSIGEWGYAEVETELLLQDLTAGYTLDELNAFGTLDELPFSLDSRAWTEGRFVLSAFDADKKLARFAGSAMNALFDTQEFGGPGRVFVDGIRPYVDGAGSPEITVALRTRNDSAGALTTSAFAPVDADGMAHFTTSTRFARARVNIAAGASWTHAQGVDYSAQPDGDL
jgi:hypothetical protein